MRRLKAAFATTAFGAMIAATPALADPITLGAGDVGSTFTLNYNGFSGGTTINGLTSTTTFKLTGVSGSSYTFDYAVKNTSTSGVNGRVSSFAFDTNPDISGASSTGTYNYTVLDSSYPNGIGSVDVCFKASGSNSCAGNSGGVYAGQTGTGTLTLQFSQPVSSLTLDNFAVRYQSVTGVPCITSASGVATSSSTTSGGTKVPEPGTVALFGLGAMAIAFRRRRKGAAPAATLRPAFA